MIPSCVRGFFPPSLEFVQESDLLSCFQSLGAMKRHRDCSLFPPHGEEGRSRADTQRKRMSVVTLESVIAGGNACTSSFHWKLSLRRDWTWGVCPLKHLLSNFLILGLFPAIYCWLLLTLSGAGVSQVCEWELELGVSFSVPFSTFILWETTLVLWTKTNFTGFNKMFPALSHSPSQVCFKGTFHWWTSPNHWYHNRCFLSAVEGHVPFSDVMSSQMRGLQKAEGPFSAALLAAQTVDVKTASDMCWKRCEKTVE